jgi:DNA gyrase subunit A
MDVIQSEDQEVLTVSANGYGKRTPVADFRPQGRGGIGIIAMDASERNGNVVNLSLITPDAELVAVTDAGQLIRTKVAEIRLAGRNTQGVRVIRLDETERVVDVGLIADREDEAGPNGSIPPPTMPPDDGSNGEGSNGV